MGCPACGAENRPGRKFCSECGSPLARACASCGAANEATDRFCGECGSALEAGVAAPPPPPAGPPASERRLVSVLFADLVGFTALSETRDAEEVRELLTRYFDTARTVIARYGGTVEKFIGDAVMAVWGTPVAREDDAERAVRTALELVGDVAALGADAGVPELHLRAGVATGEAAVTIGAEGQGMVAGDLVNTASRIQSAAAPGSVFVDEATRRSIEAAIACEDAGEHELKGKAEAVRLWRAARVIAARRGEGRSSGLEAPFVGREAEFRLVRDLLHATADEGKARLLSVIGVAGIGKSRLAWELEKYVDGLIDDVWWQRGRCLAYGEGVAYWALAEMVRMRAGIAEDENPESAVGKLRETIEEVVPDPEERAWIEPRLRHLLGLAERIAPDREDLFSAWRLFFERLTEQGPAVLLFEDLQWADAALLDFIEYLLDWSRNHPLYVVTLARPELMERHATWGAGKRSFTSLYLEPLAGEAMAELLRGLVPGLPDELRLRIQERAEGIPLYAVETVRMLLDRGILEQRGNEYALTGPVEALEVPETLHALIAARLDGLEPAEKRLLEDASVLGKTFTKRALAAVAGFDEAELEPVLSSLLRKEILSLETDPRSPERGQYGFLQALVQKVAYDTLARRERKARHLRAAAYLESGVGPDTEEIAEVLAAHYLEAYDADSTAGDAAEIKAKARDRLTAAAERAAALAAHEEAERYFEQAAALADDPLRQAELFERAGTVAWTGARAQAAEAHFERAIALLEAEGAMHPAARVSARLGNVLYHLGRIEEGVERMERSFEVLSEDEPDADLAALAAELGRLRFFTGEEALAAERIEFALVIAEALRLPEVISEALNTKSLILYSRRSESRALLEGALKVALENDLPNAALRAYYNLAETLLDADRPEEALGNARDGLALARRRGDRQWEWSMLSQMVEPLFLLGEWDEALARVEEIPDEMRLDIQILKVLVRPLARIHLCRGDLGAVRHLLEALAPGDDSADLDLFAFCTSGRAVLLRAEGRQADAVAAGERALEARELPSAGRVVAEGVVEAAEAAFALGDHARVEALLRFFEDMSPGDRTGYARAQYARLKARLAAARAETAEADQGFRAAVAHFRELGTPYWLAVSLLDQGEWLTSDGRSDEAAPLLAEARDLFERLEAHRWLDRLGTVAEALA